MKYILVILLCCVSISLSAQALTDTQRQEALQCATKFCDLLGRFSNGERTLNSQINALCSGADCSAYDDIKTNKEVTLRNYLMAIQQKYPRKLAMDITSPSLVNSKTYIEPIMSLDIAWGNAAGDSELSTAESPLLTMESVNNTYVVFDVVQKYTSLGTSINKKLIYDVKNKKITAFIIDNGAYINFLNGTLAFANKDFAAAMRYFDKAARNGRTSFQKNCYGLAMLSAYYMQDYEKAVYYAPQSGNPWYAAMFNLLQCIENEQFDSAYPYVVELESMLNTKNDFNVLTERNIYLMLANFYINPLSSHQDIDKVMPYMRKAEALGEVKAGYYVFIYYTLLGDDFVDPRTALEYLQKSAERGYPPAFYQWGRMVEYGLEDKEEAMTWYEKAANSGNYIGMASLGKLLLEKGEKSRGVEWLKKSLEGQVLEAQLRDCELSTGGLAPWPKTRADVETLLSKYNMSNNSLSNNSHSTTHAPVSTTSSSNSSYTSTSHNNSYTSSSSYTSRPRHKFNSAQDNYCVGFSAGYVQKQWIYDLGDATEKVDVFGEDKYTNGVQFGFRIDPQFGYGFGIDTGLYYEYYFDKSNDMYEDGINYYCRLEEHSLYLPVHMKYSMNFSKWFQLSLYGGVGLDYGISGKIYLRSEGETLDNRNLYDEEFDMKRFNASLEYGAAIRIRRIQLNFTMAKGFIDMSGSDEYKVKQNKLMNIGLSIYF